MAKVTSMDSRSRVWKCLTISQPFSAHISGSLRSVLEKVLRYCNNCSYIILPGPNEVGVGKLIILKSPHGPGTPQDLMLIDSICLAIVWIGGSEKPRRQLRLKLLLPSSAVFERRPYSRVRFIAANLTAHHRRVEALKPDDGGDVNLRSCASSD